MAAGRAALKTVTWRHGTKTDPDNPAAAMRSRFLALRIRPANRDITPADDGSLPEAWLIAEWPTGADRTHRLLDLQPARRHPPQGTRPPGQDPLAHRTRLPGTENRPRTGPLRGPLLDRLAPPRHPRHRRPPLPHHPAAHRPKSHWAGLTLYALVRKLQRALAHWIGTCPHATTPSQPNKVLLGLG